MFFNYSIHYAIELAQGGIPTILLTRSWNTDTIIPERLPILDWVVGVRYNDIYNQKIYVTQSDCTYTRSNSLSSFKQK